MTLFVFLEMKAERQLIAVPTRLSILPHLLRHSVATTLLERGMPIEQIQKFLVHSNLETTQIYAESTTEMLKESYRRALAE
jgi:site-specific recombinase XerD